VDLIFWSLSHIDKIWYNILGHYIYYALGFLDQKRIIRIMLGIDPMS